MIPCGQPLKGPRLSFWHSASLFMAPAGPVGSSEPSRFGAKLSYDRYRWHTSPFMIFRFDQIFMLPRPFDSPASFSLFDDSTLLHAQYKSWICTSCMWKRFVSKPALRFEMYAFAFLFGRAQSHKRATQASTHPTVVFRRRRRAIFSRPPSCGIQRFSSMAS